VIVHRIKLNLREQLIYSELFIRTLKQNIMKTKKLIVTIFGVFTFALVPTALNAQDADKPLTERIKSKVVIEKTERTDEIESRLNEIKNMDMTELDGPQKRALRQEVREIEKTTAVGGGVYISIGGLLLIIILLIILL